MVSRRLTAFAVVTILSMCTAQNLFAEELTLGKAEKQVPDAVDPAIASLIGTEVIQLNAGESPLYEFWLRKEIPLKDKPAEADEALAAVEEMTLLGVLVAHEEKRDYRDDELYEDVYTIRMSLQPEDGNHLGTSQFRYFGVLLPAGEDTNPEGFADTEEMINVSMDNTAVGHPMILSLRPAKKTEGEFPSLHEPAEEHKSVRVKVPAKTDGGESLDIVFDIVYEGVGEI